MHANLGTAYQVLEVYDLAVEHLSAALELDPTLYWFLYNRAQCYYATGDLKEAEADLRMLLKEAAPSDSVRPAQILLLQIIAESSNRR
ncbi:tetratricopeptide repeat protein [Candidatus Bipolaricaulota bacterium]|nr:tetratricopeptide repeat protein [Candidatus Bipolaricaulota bacterium]